MSHRKSSSKKAGRDCDKKSSAKKAGKESKADRRRAALAALEDPVLGAMARRRSVSRVGQQTPSDEELLALLHAVTPVADHKALRPWRLITLRGRDRDRLSAAFDKAEGRRRVKPGTGSSKPYRSELLIALVSSPRRTSSIPEWEQHATAAGAFHLLELALWQAGWGVMWRTGDLTNTKAVRRAHGLKKHELLMGWLYVGDIDPAFRQRLERSTKPRPDPAQFLGRMPS